MEQLYYAGTSEIIGQTVVDSLGNDYGKIDDIIFSSSQGRAVVAIISTNGKFNKDYIALPFQALRINSNTKQAMIEIDSQTIQDAPPVDRSLLQGGMEEELFRIFSYYGYENVWKQGSGTKEAEPLHDWHKSGENAGERHPENEGSYEITKQYPSGEDHNSIKEEADYDKIKGLPKNDK